jgi:Tellurite resistance protein TerB
MGLFDRTYKPSTISYTPANEQEAWIAIMHACIAVDEDVADEELEELSETLASKPMFEGHDVREYYRTVLLTHARIGSKQLIDISVDTVAPASKPALFAACLELLIADGILAAKEEELIRYLYSALDLEEEEAKKIINTVLDQYKAPDAGPGSAGQ